MNQPPEKPKYILFAQHGWSDNGNDIARLAEALTAENTVIIAPSLGLLKTYWRIAPLIDRVEKLAEEAIAKYPSLPVKIVGHSMGGLIWLEVLNRHPEWWHKIHSLVVIGSPISGAHLARIIDPLRWGFSIAKDLGTNRRPLAEKIARQIPTLSIAGDLGNGSDGMVTLEATKFPRAKTIIVKNVPHANLKCHLGLIPIIQEFWLNPQIQPETATNVASTIIKQLQNVPGMTEADYADFQRSQIVVRLAQGITLRTYTNSLGVDHIYVSDRDSTCLYAGYVGWVHKANLKKALGAICELATLRP